MSDRSTAPRSPSRTARDSSSRACPRSCSGRRRHCEGPVVSDSPRRFEPQPGEASAPYWEGTRKQQLVLQWCLDCEQPVHYPRVACPRCLGDAVRVPSRLRRWDRARGRRRPSASVAVRRRRSLRRRARRPRRRCAAHHERRRVRTPRRGGWHARARRPGSRSRTDGTSRSSSPGSDCLGARGIVSA